MLDSFLSFSALLNRDAYLLPREPAAPRVQMLTGTEDTELARDSRVT